MKHIGALYALCEKYNKLATQANLSARSSSSVKYLKGGWQSAHPEPVRSTERVAKPNEPITKYDKILEDIPIPSENVRSEKQQQLSPVNTLIEIEKPDMAGKQHGPIEITFPVIISYPELEVKSVIAMKGSDVESEGQESDMDLSCYFFIHWVVKAISFTALGNQIIRKHNDTRNITILGSKAQITANGWFY